jgi:DNA-binding NarL/FixJ family response regulator
VGPGQAPALHDITEHLVKAARMQLLAAEVLHQMAQLITSLAEGSSRPDPDDIPGDRADQEDVNLTPREQDVLDLLGQGMTNRLISRALGISEHTVRAHLQSIFRKLGVNQRTDALVHAMRLGLLDNIGLSTHEDATWPFLPPRMPPPTTGSS